MVQPFSELWQQGRTGEGKGKSKNTRERYDMKRLEGGAIEGRGPEENRLLCQQSLLDLITDSHDHARGFINCTSKDLPDLITDFP